MNTIKKVDRKCLGRVGTTLDDEGLEHISKEPVELPTRLRMPASQAQRIRSLIQHELSNAAAATGHETLAESDDFDLPPEEGNWISPYELRPDNEDFPVSVINGGEVDLPSPEDSGAEPQDPGPTPGAAEEAA